MAQGFSSSDPLTSGAISFSVVESTVHWKISGVSGFYLLDARSNLPPLWQLKMSPAQWLSWLEYRPLIKELQVHFPVKAHT